MIGPDVGGHAWIKVPSPLSSCWAYDLHFDGMTRTWAGDHVYRAKYHADHASGSRLGDEMALALRKFGLGSFGHVTDVDVVASVPSSYELARTLAERIGIWVGGGRELDLVTLTGPKRAMKHAGGVVGVPELSASLRVNRSVTGESVLVVDDVVRTGTTMAAVAEVLMGAGASHVIGIAATKATTGMRL